ncbi:hypothetical protein L208DRAFT_1377286 [Tricholoma matsutake]|nr:hypothetical protein L208DRAFT_1377286 [Tricholoma matsutake 945]
MDAKIQQLRIYLEHLPLSNFALSPDIDWLQDIREEDVLEKYLGLYPRSTLLLNWLDENVSLAAKQCINAADPDKAEQLDGVHVNTLSKPQKHQSLPAKSNSLACAKEKRKMKLNCVDSKILINDHDSDYIMSDEDPDERNGGGKIFPLLKLITKPCHCKKPPPGEEDKKWWDLHGTSFVRMCKEAPRAYPESDIEWQEPKWLKLTVDKQVIKESLRGVIVAKPKNDAFAKFWTEGREVLQDKGNTALMQFIICCSIPPNILSARVS